MYYYSFMKITYHKKNALSYPQQMNISVTLTDVLSMGLCSKLCHFKGQRDGISIRKSSNRKGLNNDRISNILKRFNINQPCHKCYMRFFIFQRYNRFTLCNTYFTLCILKPNKFILTSRLLSKLQSLLYRIQVHFFFFFFNTLAADG